MSSGESRPLPQYSSASELPETTSQLLVSDAHTSTTEDSSTQSAYSEASGAMALDLALLESQVAKAVEQLSAGDFHSRWDYAKQFSQQFEPWGDRIIPILIHHLETHSDVEAQWFLVRILSQFEHPSVVTALAQLLVTTSSEDLQLEVSNAIATLGKSAIATLSELLVKTKPGEAGNDTQRILAARTLSHIRRSAIIEPLLSITEDANFELRAIALEALGSFHDPRITPVLLAALQDKPAICIEAVRTLGRRSDLLATTDLIAPLQQCLLSKDETVACESAIALGRLGTEAAIAVLGKHLLRPLSTPVKIAIVQALGWLNVESAAVYLASAFTAPVPMIMPAVKKAIAGALGQTRSPALQTIAAKPLIDWLSSSQTSTALYLDPTLETLLLTQTVLSALARLGVSDALEWLVPILSHPDPRLRMHALNALKQIDPRAAQAQAQSYLQRSELSPVKKQYVSEALAAW